MTSKEAFEAVLEKIDILIITNWPSAREKILLDIVKTLCTTINDIREEDPPIYIIDPHVCYMPDLLNIKGVEGRIVRVRKAYWGEPIREAIKRMAEEQQKELDNE